MPRVICNLPNASDEISGVKFHPLDDGGLISDEIDAAVAEHFASIPGYELADADEAPAKVETKPAPRTRAKKAAEAPAPAAPAAPAAEAATVEPVNASQPESADPAAEAETPAAGEDEVF